MTDAERIDRLERVVGRLVEAAYIAGAIDVVEFDKLIDMLHQDHPASGEQEQAVLPEEHPMKKAWNAWCDTDEFKGSLRWAVETRYDDGRPVGNIQREQHAKGAMWLAFTKGMLASGEQGKG